MTSYWFFIKRFSFFILLSSFGLSSYDASAQSLDIRNTATYHPGGGLKSKAEYYYDAWSEQEIRHGRYAEWDGRGNRIVEAFYVHGKRMGKSVHYYSDDTPKAIEHWANGRLNGKCRYFFPDGSLKQEAHYLNGLPNGTWKWYRRDGSLKLTKTFKAGELIEGGKVPKRPKKALKHKDPITPKF